MVAKCKIFMTYLTGHRHYQCMYIHMFVGTYGCTISKVNEKKTNMSTKQEIK